MNKPLNKATLILWIIGGLTILGSLLSFSKDPGTAVVGIVLGLVLGLIGYLVGRKRKGADEAAPVASDKAASPYIVRKYRVAGVTFTTGKSGRKSRQSLLRAMRFGDPPFDGEYSIVPKVYDFEGKPAIGLYVNGDEFEQIGNIPAENVPEVLPLMDKLVKTECEAYGGDEGKNWGAVVYLTFEK